MESVFLTKITRIGSSHGVVIPIAILNAYNWQRGDMLMFGFAGGDQLFLRRITDTDLQKLKSESFRLG